MIEIINGWGESWTGYFGLAVLQNTLFVGLILLALHFMRNTRASMRYALCLVGMVKLLLPPFLPAGFLEVPDKTVAAVPLSGLYLGEPASTVGRLAGPAAGRGLGLGGLLFVVWSGAAILYLAYSVLAALRLRRELKGAVPVEGPPAIGQVERSGIEIRRADTIPVALTFGLLRPRIYVPRAWDDWSKACRRMVLAHEAAHIRRWDRLGQVLQVFAKAFYFFHPLVWMLDRRMNKYREMACDDAATEMSPTRAAAYSHYLVEIAEKVMLRPVSWRTASAFLNHKNGLLERVRYQLEAREMKKISTRTSLFVFAGLVLLTLPLSWYCGKAETEQIPAEPASSSGKAAKNFEEVEILLKPDRVAVLSGEVIAFDDLGDVLTYRFPSDRENVIIRLECEDGVVMEEVSEVHEILVATDLTKVIYEGPPREGLPLVLPSLENQEKLADVPGEHVAVVKVDLPGRAVLDGKPVKITDIKQAIENRLAEDPYLVVSLVWAPTCTYDDFLMVLGLVKAAGANRIAVQIGS